MATYTTSYKAISSALSLTRCSSNTWICRGFVTVTRLSHQSKVDKETCEKVIEAADTVKEGTKTVVHEVKKVGQVITNKVANTTGNMVADAASKGFEKAAEGAKTQRSKDVLDTAKSATDAFKGRLKDDNNKDGDKPK